MLRTDNLIKFLFITFLGIVSQTIYSQNDSISGISYIQKLINTDSLQKAELQLNKQIDYLKAEKKYDSLISYIPLVGSFNLAKGNSKKAIEKAEIFVTELKQLSNPSISIDALIELSNIYFNARLHDKNYSVSGEALIIARKASKTDPLKISEIEYNMGTAQLNLGNINKGKEHLYKSKKILETHNNPKLEHLYNTYNSIGRAQSSLTQIDSSTFYYKKALETLDRMNSTEGNKNYWKAIVNNNIALNFQNTGKTDEAIKYITDAIFDFQKFADTTKDESRKLRARRFRLTTIDNLATFYEGIGEYNRTVELLTYSYQEKLKFLSEDDSNVMFSLVLLGHANLKIKNYKAAAKFIDKALSIIDLNPENYSFLHSFTLTVSASIYEATNDLESAKRMYEESETLYNKTFDGTYSADHLDALIEMSKFYAKKNEKEKAIELALQGYYYTKDKKFENDLIQFNHTQNLADIYLELEDYNAALKYSEESLLFFKVNKIKPETLIDSIQNEFRKPGALFINIKSKYQLKKEKDVPFLESLLTQIKEGISILERRKIITQTPEDLNLLIEDNNNLFDFAKQITLDIYEQTNNKIYLQDLISMHESSLYNRIRSHLNIRNNIAFNNIPEKVIAREKYLKTLLNTSLIASKSTIEGYIETSNNWKVFLDSLKLTYPKYYKMRYATIEEPLDDLQKNIPKNTSVVRYFFIQKQLYALIINENEKNIFNLNSDSLEDNINTLEENQSDFKVTSTLLQKLYTQLWQPFESNITTKNVIIIPDGTLFNLSFETLTPTKIKSFNELATNSLLAKHYISYNYSLLLFNKNRKTINYTNDFIAFAPEFNDKMKEDYKIAITDSLVLDKSYLTLLPQPFTVDLAKEYSELFNGSSFLNEKASKQLFTNEAKEHKIIHIGTHAESNNVSPELSRLIFAKNTAGENNSLYTYEIYNQNLSSNLAILTACETGKPTYQAGEGMISLAHAFNYAGSESILTSLWKIDEQSSAKIIKNFYNYIKKGVPKDEALQKAKLNYISTAEGRTIDPQYWAGLVLIGDASPIQLTAFNTSFWWIIIVVFGIALLCVLWFSKSKEKPDTSLK